MGEEADSSEVKFAKNKAELCRVIGITRPTLDAWIQLPGHPRTTSNGRYIVAEWRAYAATRRVDDAAEETASLKLEKLREEVEQAKIKTMREAGDLVPRAWMEQTMAHLALNVRNVIQCSALAENDKAQLTQAIEAIDCDEFIDQLLLQSDQGPVAAEPQKGEALQLAESPAAA